MPCALRSLDTVCWQPSDQRCTGLPSVVERAWLAPDGPDPHLLYPPMKRWLGSTLIAGAVVALAVLLWRGRLGRVISISSESGTSGSTNLTVIAGEIDVNWQVVIPLIIVAGVGILLLTWPRWRSRADR